MVEKFIDYFSTVIRQLKLNPIEVDPVVDVPNVPNEPKENNGDVLVESSPKRFMDKHDKLICTRT